MPRDKKRGKDIPTENQARVLNFVMDALKTTGKPPTLREISNHFHYVSHQSAKQHLLALDRKGYLKYGAYQARGLELTPKALKLPVLGWAAAGSPIMSESDVIGEIIPILDLRTRFPDLFVVRARGDSMIQAGIFDGDYVAVAKSKPPRSGAIVLALVDGAVTIKRLIRKTSGVELHPENPRYAPLLLRGTSSHAILGVVVAIYRSLF